MKKLRAATFLVLLLAFAARAEEISVAAASDLQFVFPELAAQFQKQTGHTVKLTFGSSGNFFSQIQNGAPFDLFFSADMDYPRKLEAAGLVEPGSLYSYAVGRIVLWVPQNSALDLVPLGMNALLDPSVRKIAIANPRHAPYGRAAVAAMRYFGVYDKVAGKLVLGENISQTAQFVEAGGAEIGVIARSLAVAPVLREKGRYWEIPLDSYPRIEQAAVILKSSTKKKAAAAFLHYLRTAEAGTRMRRYGFTRPEKAAP